MRTFHFNRLKISEFSSPSDLLDFVNSNINKKDWSVPERIIDDNYFYGCKSMESAINQLQFGDPLYTKSFIDGLNEIKNEEIFNSDVFMDIEGFAYDMGAVVNNEPECCLNTGFPETKKSIDIIVSISFAGHVDTSAIKNRGIAIANLINTLLTKGYIVNLKFVRFHNGRMIHLYNIDTKTQSISTLAFFCTPQFFRALNFLIDEIVWDRVGVGGKCTSFADMEFLNSLDDKNTFFIEGGYDDDRMNNLYSIEKANSYISKLFNDFIKKFEEK